MNTFTITYILAHIGNEKLTTTLQSPRDNLSRWKAGRMIGEGAIVLRVSKS